MGTSSDDLPPIDPQATTDHRSESDGSPPDRDVQLQMLWALLGTQAGLVDRKRVREIVERWTNEGRKTPLATLFVDGGAITGEARTLLDALVDKHLELHDHDPARSLADLSSLGTVAEELRQIPDREVLATLVYAQSGTTGNFASSDGRVSTDGRKRFRIIKPHARGGLGEVFVARDEELNREVALKEIQSRFADDIDSRGRFLKEAEITGRLEHPGIVPVYGLGTYADGRPYYAMRFIQGDSLKDAIERFHDPKRKWKDAGERELEFRKLLQRFIDVCNAIEYAHSRGVLHRDLKPGNIMLGQYGETLVVDWGLAKPIGAKEEPSSNSSTPQPLEVAAGSGSAPTQYGQALGTPAYMSPEQAAGRLDELGPASDVYSLGATLYTLLTGQLPVEGNNVGELLSNVQHGAIKPIRSDVPRPLASICLRSLASKPKDRYGRTRELSADIERWLANEEVSCYREPLLAALRRRSRRHPVAFTAISSTLLLAVLLLTVSGTSAFLIRRDSEKTYRAINRIAQFHMQQVIRILQQSIREEPESLQEYNHNIAAALTPYYEQETSNGMSQDDGLGERLTFLGILYAISGHDDKCLETLNRAYSQDLAYLASAPDEDIHASLPATPRQPRTKTEVKWNLLRTAELLARIKLLSQKDATEGAYWATQVKKHAEELQNAVDAEHRSVLLQVVHEIDAISTTSND